MAIAIAFVLGLMYGFICSALMMGRNHDDEGDKK